MKNTLWSLPQGKTALISSIKSNSNDALIQRLNDLGIDQGKEISCLKQTPFGGPRVFQVALSTLALDQETASTVEITYP